MQDSIFSAGKAPSVPVLQDKLEAGLLEAAARSSYGKFKLRGWLWDFNLFMMTLLCLGVLLYLVQREQGKERVGWAMGQPAPTEARMEWKDGPSSV